MANALKRELTEGDTVILVDGTLAVVTGGFGMHTFTAGAALFVKRNGEDIRVNACHDLNVEATRKHNHWIDA